MVGKKGKTKVTLSEAIQQNAKDIQALSKTIFRNGKTIREGYKASEKKQKYYADEAKELLNKIDGKFQEICKTIESWEESLMLIFHNIKKNQWLYSHYPDEWLKNYLDAKKIVKVENKNLESICKKKNKKC